jgi:uncharacterized membrane protein YfcA
VSPEPEAGLATLLAAAAVAGFVIGFLKNAVGGGIGLVLTPILTLVLSPRTVLALTAVQLNLANPVSLRYYWGRWDGRQVAILLPAALAGIVSGGALLAHLSDAALRRAIGVTALAGALVQLALLVHRVRRAAPARVADTVGGSPPGAPPRGGPGPAAVLAGVAVGLAGGVASAVAHSGGLLVGPYLAGLGLSSAAVVATGLAVVVVADVVKLVTYAQIGFLTWPVAGASVAGLPALLAGSWAGYRLNRRLPRTGLALALIAIAVAGSVRLLLG